MQAFWKRAHYQVQLPCQMRLRVAYLSVEPDFPFGDLHLSGLLLTLCRHQMAQS